MSYLGNEGYYGDDVFSYRVMDASRLLSNEAQVFVEILPTVAVANSDYFEVDYSRSITFDILRNDTTIGGSFINPSSVQLVDYPSYGELIVDADGRVRYTPHPNFTGQDQFTYRVQDSHGMWSEVAVVKILSRGFLIPNVFTPNGDGTNDTFEILGTYAYERISLEVVDRFGRLVFKAKDYQNDRTAEGHPDGIYFFVLKGYRDGRGALRE